MISIITAVEGAVSSFLRENYEVRTMGYRICESTSMAMWVITSSGNRPVSL
jgi:hypothetical protein